MKKIITFPVKTVVTMLGVVPALLDIIYLILTEITRIQKKYGKVEQMSLVLILSNVSDGVKERSNSYAYFGVVFWAIVLAYIFI